MHRDPEVLPAAEFQADFAAEVRRAKRYNTLLAYLELESAPEAEERLRGVLRRGLRESDLLGVLGGGRFGVVLIAADDDAASIVLGRLAAAAKADGLAIRCRRAVFPFDGLDADALVGALR